MITKNFATAGKAIFTVQNAEGVHYTFRINKVQNDGQEPVLFASLLTGPDNDSDYTYLGIVSLDGRIVLTKKSRYTFETLPVKVLQWAIRLVWANANPPAGYAIKHEGRCGRCGRTLTVPESIDTGLGPECAKLVGV